MALGHIPSDIMPPDAAADDVVYVLDRALNVVFASRSWVEFARRNGGQRVLAENWNAHALDNFSGREKQRWLQLYAALMSGRVAGHTEDILCPSPVERRMYQLHVIVHRDVSGEVSYLVHHAVALRGAVYSRPPADIRADYRARVLARVVAPPHFRAAQCVVPLEDVGGDLLWQHALADGRSEVVLADVVGHGVRAARMAIRITELLDGAAQTHDIARKVSWLNDCILGLHARAPHGATPLFATGMYLLLDPMQRCIEVCSFAHHGPIFSEAGAVEVPTGLPLGVAREFEPWPTVSLRFADHGDRFMIYSDGMIEQFDANGEMFTVQRLVAGFFAVKHLPVDQVLAELFDQVEAFRGSALVKDDRTMLAIEHVR